MLELQSKQQLQQLISQNQVVIVDVFADWCNPCKILAPKFEELSRQYAMGGVVFCKAESNKNLIDDIRGLPSIFFYVKGKQHHVVLGADVNEIKGVLARLFPQVKPQALLSEQNENNSINRPNVGYNTKNSNVGGGYRSYGRL